MIIGLRFVPVSLVIFMCTFISFVYSDEEVIDSLEKIVVTASRIPSALSSTDRSITVIDKREIELMPVHSIPELLGYVTGVDIRQRGAGDVQSDIHIRGCSFEQTLVLLDGMKINDPQTGHHNFDIPITLQDIERIEVLRGHATRLYGPGAFGGVVNIITKKEKRKTVNTSASGGEYGFADLSVSFTFPAGPTYHRLSARKNVSAGHREGTEYDITGASYKGCFENENYSQELFVGFINKPFGAASFYVPGSNEWEHTKTFLANTKANISIGNLSLINNIFLRIHKDKWLYDREKPDLIKNEHKTISFGGEILSIFPSSFGESVFGISGSMDTIKSNSLGDHFRYNFGFSALQKYSMWNRISIEPGILIYYCSNRGWDFFPGFDIGIRIVDKLRLYGTMGKSYRLPSYTEYYMDNSVMKGDPDLEPGEAGSMETGLKYSQRVWNAASAIYYRKGQNIIDWIIDSSGKQVVKGRKITTLGTEFTLNLFPEKMSDILPVSIFSINYSYIKTKLDKTPGFTSKYLANPMQHQAGATITYNYLKWLKHTLNHTWAMKYEKRIGQDGYLLLDTRMVFQVSGVSVFLEITNLLDTEYNDVISVPAPGRWFKGGVSISLTKDDER